MHTTNYHLTLHTLWSDHFHIQKIMNKLTHFCVFVRNWRFDDSDVLSKHIVLYWIAHCLLNEIMHNYKKASLKYVNMLILYGKPFLLEKFENIGYIQSNAPSLVADLLVNKSHFFSALWYKSWPLSDNRLWLHRQDFCRREITFQWRESRP